MTFADLFKRFNLLSLDVALGAMISSWMFWQLPFDKREINYLAIGILGIATWLYYIIDRLVDNIHLEIKDERHQFHETHQYNLQILVIVLFLLSLFLAIFLPKQILNIGFIQSTLLLSYFWFIHKFKENQRIQQLKEIITAILYTFCVIGGPYSLRQNIYQEDYIVAGNFFLLVHQSMLMFSAFEWQKNQKSDNLYRLLGKKFSNIDIYGIFLLQAIIMYLYRETDIFKILSIQALMALSTMLIYHFSKNDFIQEKYRNFGELVFFLPLLVKIITFF